MIVLPENADFFLIYIALFVGILLVLEGLRQSMGGSETHSDARSRRMNMIQQGASPEDMLELLKTPNGEGRHGIFTPYQTLRSAMRQAGMTLHPALLLAICLGGAVLIFGVAMLYTSLYLAAGAAFGIGIFTPLVVVNLARKQRMEKMIDQLPDALDLMARGLKVGHPLNVSIETVASDMSGPIAAEFAIIADQISFGNDITTAVDDFSRRVEQEDVHYLSVSIGIQHGSGGNLSRILEVLAKTIRDRAMMRRKVKALSSEGRLSAKILSALPVLIYLATSVGSPEYYQGIRDDPLYMPLAITIVFLVVANFLALRKLVNFKI